MLNLIRFFAKNSPFFTWLLLAIVCIIMLCNNNPYHRSVWFGSANAVVGGVYDVRSGITSYFGLRQINEDLLTQNGLLETENLQLRQQLETLRQQQEEQQLALASGHQYEYRIAHVVGNSITQAANYITLDKGAADGLRQDLGVADQNGVVGIISRVSEHYSLVISLLNPNLRLSVCLKNTEEFGSLVWDGSNYREAIVEDLPRNVRCQPGDTIVTTGYTSSFPKDVPVGIVTDMYDDGGSFLTLRLELFTDFNRLNDVHVIINKQQEEQAEIENIE